MEDMKSDKLNIEMQGLRLRIKIFSTFTIYSILQPVYLSLQPPVQHRTFNYYFFLFFIFSDFRKLIANKPKADVG